MKLILVALFCVVACEVVYGWDDPYNQMEGKCGCCPLPCCCKCIETEEPQEPVECPSAKPPVVECKSKINIGFIVDVSASIGPDDLPKVQSFLKQIINSLSEYSLTALVSYASNATVEWDFSDPEASDPALAGMAIDNFEMGRFTNVVEAIEKMLVVVDTTIPDNSVPRAYIVLSDGRSFIRQDEFLGFADQLKNDGVVAVVGATNLIFEPELRNLSSSGEFTFVEDFDGLEDIINPIIMEVCVEVEVPTAPPCTTPPPVVVESECFCCCPPPFRTTPPKYDQCEMK